MSVVDLEAEGPTLARRMERGEGSVEVEGHLEVF